ncbi:hypothetical protein M1O51_00755 [Dehalococcoidia bacterium]|nr:hypothetical protein [Dehalococcoidia bacterium]
MAGGFFLKLEDILDSSRDRVNRESLEAGRIALDEEKVNLLHDKLDKSTEVVLTGPRDSGKTVTAKALGFKLLTQHGFVCFYGNVRDLSDVSEAIGEIQAYEEGVSARTLFILEDCHTEHMKVETLLQRLGGKRQNTALLLTTRYSLREREPATIADEVDHVRLEPEKLRADIVRKHIEQLRAQPTYRNSRYFPKDDVEMETQISRLLARLPKKNLRILDIYLHTWDPCRGPLDKVDERQILKYLQTRATPSLSSYEAKTCLLPLYAIGQYEVGVHTNFFEDEPPRKLKDLGVVRSSEVTNLCYPIDPSEAPWYLKAAEQARLLSVEGELTNVTAYVKHYVLKYAAEAPNPENLLRALRRENRDLAEQVILDPKFEDHVKRLSREPLFQARLPNLFLELRTLGHIEICARISEALTDNDLNEVGKIGVDTVGKCLCEFLSWGGVWRQKGREFAKRLMLQQSVQPETLARDFMAGLDSGRYGVHDLATLLFGLNSLGTYNIYSLIRFLDLPKLQAKFPETRLTPYIALLREAKRARVGLDPVLKLTPKLQVIHQRVRERSASSLRQTMDALLMPDRKQLWNDLSDQELQEILTRSTLNQLYNFLLDALESDSEESKELGAEIATRLVGLGLSGLIAEADLKDVSMFIRAATRLNPELAKPLLDQLLQAGLARILEQEKAKEQVVSKLNFVLRHFSVATDVASQFLRELSQLNLLPYIQASSPDSLRNLTYEMLMTDKQLSGEWFLGISQQVWKQKISEAPEKDALWLLFNLFQGAPDLARSLGNQVEIQEKLIQSPAGLGLLLLSGVTIRNAAVTLRGLPDSLAEPWDASRLALTLRGLCSPDLRGEALQVRASLDLVKVKETFQNARALSQTKELYMKILAEFEELNEVSDPG